MASWMTKVALVIRRTGLFTVIMFFYKSHGPVMSNILKIFMQHCLFPIAKNVRALSCDYAIMKDIYSISSYYYLQNAYFLNSKYNMIKILVFFDARLLLITCGCKKKFLFTFLSFSVVQHLNQIIKKRKISLQQFSCSFPIVLVFHICIIRY